MNGSNKGISGAGRSQNDEINPVVGRNREKLRSEFSRKRKINTDPDNPKEQFIKRNCRCLMLQDKLSIDY